MTNDRDDREDILWQDHFGVVQRGTGTLDDEFDEANDEDLMSDKQKLQLLNAESDTEFDGFGMHVSDAFRCHRIPCLKEIVAKCSTDLVIIPGGMTSQLQVMDVSCNRPFKQEMRKRWNEWIFYGVHSFTNSGNTRQPGLPLIAKRIIELWNAIDPNIVKRGFKICLLLF